MLLMRLSLIVDIRADDAATIVAFAVVALATDATVIVNDVIATFCDVVVVDRVPHLSRVLQASVSTSWHASPRSRRSSSNGFWQ